MNLNEEYAYKKGFAPQTRTIISTKNKIYAKPSKQTGFLQIGVVSTFNPSDNRTVDPVRGIGYGDQIAELVPGISDPITIAVTRTALYLSLMMQTFGYTAGVDGLVRALKHHRWPFDIKQEIVLSEIADKNIKGATGTRISSEAPLRALLTFYEACWMNSYNWSFTSDTSVVQEDCNITVSDIIDGKSNYQQFVKPFSVDSGNNPYISGNGSSVRYGTATL